MTLEKKYFEVKRLIIKLTKNFIFMLKKIYGILLELRIETKTEYQILEFALLQCTKKP